MWFRKLFSRKKTSKESKNPTVGQGIAYLYLIISLQVIFVLGLMFVIISIGKVLMTPLWLLALVFFTVVAGCGYIYRIAKRKLKRFTAALKQVGLESRNYEISLMGGMLTMRIEQAPPLLDHNSNRLVGPNSLGNPDS